jgi:hypothetical protein
MSPRKNTTKLSFNLSSTDRAEIWSQLFKLWAEEAPGTFDVTNNYIFTVEHLSDDSTIYLSRPTRLNKDADFIIHCQNYLIYKNGNSKPPSHKDLFKEVLAIIENDEEKLEILNAVDRIYKCEDSAKVIEKLKLFSKSSAANRERFVRVERALLLAKWFFIEQDLTYWTQSGRHMLRRAFSENIGEFPVKWFPLKKMRNSDN